MDPQCAAMDECQGGGCWLRDDSFQSWTSEIVLFSTLDNVRCHALLVRESVHCTVASEVIGLRITWASAEGSHVVALLSERYSYRGSDHNAEMGSELTS